MVTNVVEDIRTSKKAATLKHASARGKVYRNADNFTRGSQLFTHQLMMTWAGLRIPLFIWTSAFGLCFSVIAIFYFRSHEMQLVLAKIWAEFLLFVGIQYDKTVNLTLANGSVVQGPMFAVPYHSDVMAAWNRMMNIF